LSTVANFITLANFTRTIQPCCELLSGPFNKFIKQNLYFEYAKGVKKIEQPWKNIEIYLHRNICPKKQFRLIYFLKSLKLIFRYNIPRFVVVVYNNVPT
jgi:hypothetical protein